MTEHASFFVALFASFAVVVQPLLFFFGRLPNNAHRVWHGVRGKSKWPLSLAWWSVLYTIISAFVLAALVHALDSEPAAKHTEWEAALWLIFLGSAALQPLAAFYLWAAFRVRHAAFFALLNAGVQIAALVLLGVLGLWLSFGLYFASPILAVYLLVVSVAIWASRTKREAVDEAADRRAYAHIYSRK